MFRWRINTVFSVNFLHAQSFHSITADKKNSDSDSGTLITDCKEGENCIIARDIPSHFEVSEPNLLSPPPRPHPLSPKKSILGF